MLLKIHKQNNKKKQKNGNFACHNFRNIHYYLYTKSGCLSKTEIPTEQSTQLSQKSPVPCIRVFIAVHSNETARCKWCFHWLLNGDQHWTLWVLLNCYLLHISVPPWFCGHFSRLLWPTMPEFVWSVVIFAVEKCFSIADFLFCIPP